MISYSLPDFPFRRASHDRLADRRGDAEFLDQAWNDPKTRVLVMRDMSLATSEAGDELRFASPDRAPEGERMLLGRADGAVHFLLLTAAPPGPADGEQVREKLHADDSIHDPPFSTLRHLATRLDPVHASLAVHAVSLAGWHLRHPRCSACGAATDVVDSGASRKCPTCSALHFPRTDPAVIMLVVDDEDRCLLGHNAAREPGWFSTLAGFVEPGESPDEAVVREVAEECGVEIDEVTYAGSQPWPFPSQLMLGYFAHAGTTDITVDGAEITDARWFTRQALQQAVEAGDVGLPAAISISYALVAAWYGAEAPQNRLSP